LTSTSCKEIAEEVLERCLAGETPKVLPRALAEEACGQALFGILAEGLADRFDPPLSLAYARLFAQAIAYANPEMEPGALVARYERVRRPRRVLGKPHRVFVLSRVTLGADVAITSVMLAAARRRFPHAETCFVGPAKNSELFAADRHIHHIPLEYRRGGLRERLAIWSGLQSAMSADDAVVVDPDSRLTQLGLFPICDEDRHHLFESRAYGGNGHATLSELAAAWAMETFGGPPTRPFVALRRLTAHVPHVPNIAVSLGVGDNPLKRIPDPFEEELLRLLAGTGLAVSIDAGAGGEEAGRVARALERSGVKATVWEGSFAKFAQIIAASKLYVGYDSAGQHVAAATGVPLITIFAGFPSARMFERWRPAAPNVTVIRSDSRDPEECLARVKEALAASLAARE